MNRLPIILAAAALLGCSQPLSFTPYEPATKEFTIEVPKGWPLETRGALAKDSAELAWIGEVVKQHEGLPYGAVLYLHKLARGRSADTEALFASKAPADVKVQAVTVAGLPARAFSREYRAAIGGGLHGAAESFPMRAEGVAIQASKAYWVIEYRATPDLFARHRPAYDRFLRSFSLRN